MQEGMRFYHDAIFIQSQHSQAILSHKKQDHANIEPYNPDHPELHLAIKGQTRLHTTIQNYTIHIHIPYFLFFSLCILFPLYTLTHS
jgi:hypothetical protein